jgi:glycine/D-amino acid oxidase-like deaminating enzyme
MVSIWEKDTFFAPQDVIIAGSGFVGLWSAFYLKKKHPRLKISILDQGWIPTGASTRNAGFACFGSLSEVIHDAQFMGTEKMLELVEMRFLGLEKIRKVFDEEKIDFDLCGGYELYADAISSEQLLHNIDYINSLLKPVTGSKKTYRIADDKIESFGFGKTHHLVKNKLEGYLHSGKLVQALLQKVQGMGVQVFNQTKILSFEERQDDLNVRTNQLTGFTTKQLLICTNAFARELLPEEDIIPARGQVVLTSPIEHLPFQGSFHSDEGYYYFRKNSKCSGKLPG